MYEGGQQLINTKYAGHSNMWWSLQRTYNMRIKFRIITCYITIAPFGFNKAIVLLTERGLCINNLYIFKDRYVVLMQFFKVVYISPFVLKGNGKIWWMLG